MSTLALTLGSVIRIPTRSTGGPGADSTGSEAECRGGPVADPAPHRDRSAQLRGTDQSGLVELLRVEADRSDEELPAGRGEPVDQLRQRRTAVAGHPGR